MGEVKRHLPSVWVSDKYSFFAWHVLEIIHVWGWLHWTKGDSSQMFCHFFIDPCTKLNKEIKFHQLPVCIQWSNCHWGSTNTMAFSDIPQIGSPKRCLTTTSPFTATNINIGKMDLRLFFPPTLLVWSISETHYPGAVCTQCYKAR